jgi:F420-dependent oxidoreductase-like protein
MESMRFRIFVEPQEGATYADQLAVAQLAEQLGFDAFFRSDHYISFTFGDGLPGPTDAWTTLAGIARETTTLRLGTLVSPVTFRHPGPLAITVAQVDAMSDGRAELGLGAGWNDREHAAYGIPFPPTRERFDIFEEQLAIITGLWATPPGEQFSFAGEHYSLVDSPALPKPVQQPPPLVIGGAGPTRTPRLAARFASEFNVMFAPPDQYPTIVGRVHAACEQIGRDPATLPASVANTVICGADEAELTRRAERVHRTAKTARSYGIGGTPGEVVDRIGAYRDVGADTIYLQVLDMRDLDHLFLIASEVLPAFS